MRETSNFSSELRRTAEEFMLTVSVAAEAEGVEPTVLALHELADAVARLQERGAVGSDPDAGESALDWS